MKEISINILLDASGKVHVNAPMGDKILCYGLLEVAKEAIKAFRLPEPSPIKVAHTMPTVKE